MKLFFGEFKSDYDKYRFPYQVWLLREDGDEVEKIYENGFLPIRSLASVYYLCRSVRVELSLFEPSSENRRILKKTEGISASLVPLSQFNYSVEVQKLCHDYAEKRLGKDVFPVPAIKSIFSGKIYNQVLVYNRFDKTPQFSAGDEGKARFQASPETNGKAVESLPEKTLGFQPREAYKSDEDREVGYAVCFVNHDLIQYAHAFYDLNFLSENLGARMMLEAVNLAKEREQKYIYLGTCYQESSLYKTEFKGVEFFNGFSWSKNSDELKKLIQRRGEEFLLKDKEHLEKYYQGDLHQILNNFGVRVNF